MARIEVHGDRVTVILSNAEKVLAFRRSNVVIERSAIRSALITDDPWIWIRGVPSPGTHLAGRVACGVWRGLGGEDFLLIRGKHQAVVIDVEQSDDKASQTADEEFSHFGRVIIATAHASELIRALRLSESETPSVHSTRKRDTTAQG